MKRLLFSILLFSLGFVSCEDAFLNRCFSGEIKVVREEIKIDSAVKRMYVLSEADVYLYYDDEQKIEIEFPENLIEDVEYKYEKGELSFTNNVTCKWRKENYAPKLHVSLPHAVRFDIIDYSHVWCEDTLKYDNITFYSLGTADFHLLADVKNMRIQCDYVADFYMEGKAENLNILYKGLGRFYGKDFQAQHITVTHQGENDLYIHPLQSLKATLENVGNVFSYNVPEELEYSELSSGKVYFEE